MPDLTQFAFYFAAALLLAVTPGPGILYVAARTLAGGRAEGAASSFGTGLGGTIHVLAGSLGVSAVVLASAELFTPLKLIGAAYLVWVGFRIFQAASWDASIVLAGRTVAPPIGPRRAFREGVLVEALNPKTATRPWAPWLCNSWRLASCRSRSTPSRTSWSPLRRAAPGMAPRRVPR